MILGLGLDDASDVEVDVDDDNNYDGVNDGRNNEGQGYYKDTI